MRRIDADEFFKNFPELAIEPYINAPTITVEDNQPTGTWIPEEETYTDLSGTIETYTRFKCDRCLQGQNFGPYPFCPWCGSKMNQEIKEGKKDEQNGT